MEGRKSMDGSASAAKREGGRHPIRGPRAGAPGRLLAGLLALTLAASACRTPRKSSAPTFVSEIEAQNRRLEELFRAGNLLGVADLYTDDGELVDSRGERTRGREEIDAYWSSIERPIDWTLKVRAIRGSENVAYELGTSTLTSRRDGQVRVSVNDFVLLWRREPDGVWRIALDAYWPRPQ